MPVHDPCGMQKVQAPGHVQHDAPPPSVPRQLVRIIPIQRMSQIASLQCKRCAPLDLLVTKTRANRWQAQHLPGLCDDQKFLWTMFFQPRIGERLTAQNSMISIGCSAVRHAP